MEMGSFLELELQNSGEFYKGDADIARLNTGRSGIYHALKLMNISYIHLPYYLCPTVRDFLEMKGVNTYPYNIDSKFEPVLMANNETTAILIVNYFGILSKQKLVEICSRFKNVILDNCPSFYDKPLIGCYNIYSARKFFGVPDGSYVIGPDASDGTLGYSQDCSSGTSEFLLKRIERSSSEVYQERMRNENRLDNSDIMTMSPLTRRILQSIDYERIRLRRTVNFSYAHSLFGKYNLFDPTEFMDSDSVPMVYPLLYMDYDLADKLRNKKIYVGRWWKRVLAFVGESSFEASLSNFMVPMPIDHRYSNPDLDYMFSIFRSVISPKLSS